MIDFFLMHSFLLLLRHKKLVGYCYHTIGCTDGQWIGMETQVCDNSRMRLFRNFKLIEEMYLLKVQGPVFLFSYHLVFIQKKKEKKRHLTKTVRKQNNIASTSCSSRPIPWYLVSVLKRRHFRHFPKTQIIDMTYCQQFKSLTSIDYILKFWPFTCVLSQCSEVNPHRKTWANF